MSSTSLLEEFGNPLQRVERAIEALKNGNGVLLMDDENRENEGDLIFSAQHLTDQQMALMIRECSGIVCLCLTQERANWLELLLWSKITEVKTKQLLRCLLRRNKV